jgi:hypothetical protein
LFERKRGSHEAGCVTRVKQSWRVRSLICNEKTPIVLSEKTAMRLRSQGPLYVRGEAGHPGGGQENNNWEKMKGRGGGEAKRSCWSPPPKKASDEFLSCWFESRHTTTTNLVLIFLMHVSNSQFWRHLWWNNLLIYCLQQNGPI